MVPTIIVEHISFGRFILFSMLLIFWSCSRRGAVQVINSGIDGGVRDTYYIQYLGGAWWAMHCWW